ncbi:hypothetical protein CQR48_1622 [Bifidobacterium thermophilum]|nr:hypothetical protein CQR48_1622 [Bifidobacterium thermophilum]
MELCTAFTNCQKMRRPCGVSSSYRDILSCVWNSDWDRWYTTCSKGKKRKHYQTRSIGKRLRRITRKLLYEEERNVNDVGCDWYCDNCDIELNSQSGFTVENGSWRCEICGYVNDVSADNIVSSEEADSRCDSSGQHRIYVDGWRINHDTTGALGDIVFTCPYCRSTTPNMLFVSTPKSELLESGFETDQCCNQCGRNVIVVCTSSNFLGDYFQL